ncbi:GspH/FimT family pseudopilin [Halopseudomonas sp.]|uniref:GspH/FimT family pseudopilin n=1 Tax=Halopseudomonas sp. TaxID=2901191 RepID=UPI00300156B6
MRSVKGFTVIELMVTVALAAIVLAIALPSFKRSIASNQLQSTTQDLISSINTARMQSVSTRQNTTIDPVGGSWANGWTLTYGADAIEDDKEFSAARDTVVAREDGMGALTFLSRGGMVSGGAVLSVCHTTGLVNGRTITLNFLGKVTTETKVDCP